MSDTVYDLAAVIKREKAAGQDKVKLANGKMVPMLRPALWPDATWTALANDDYEAAGRYVFGDRYADFVAGGGTMLALSQAVKLQQGSDLGESAASTDS